MSTKRIRNFQIIFISLCVILVGCQYWNNSEPVTAGKLAAKYTSENSTVSGVAKDFGKVRASIALREYGRGVKEATRGCNCGPDIDKYTENNPAQWCTMFASWITKEAGSPLIDQETRSWRIANSRVFEANLIANGTYFTKAQIQTSDVKPKIGDYMIFSRGDEESGLGHVGIVAEYNADTNRIGMVSGNFRDRIAYQRDYSYSEQSGFLGFGRPEK